MDQRTVENLVDASHTRMLDAAEKMDQIRDQMRQIRESIAACQANTRTIRSLVQSVGLEDADKVAAIRRKLQEMQALSHWDGMPESLDAYFYDAIQAMARLERQLRSS